MPHDFSRRNFLRKTGAFGSALWVAASGAGARTYKANEEVRAALVGVGGRGDAHLEEFPKAGGRIVALCDVDERPLKRAAAGLPEAETFRDFRVMLEKAGARFDAVIVATPDHTHAVIASSAIKCGKHVYVEKPLARTLDETRRLTELAAKAKVATQMGNQGHSGDNTRKIVELVRAGVIGSVREVHAWTNRPIWPQGLDRPADRDAPPTWLDWDLWLGPAPDRPYVADRQSVTTDLEGRERHKNQPVYHPFAWRGWWDFGTGAIGDMACHILDPAYWALDLKNPVRIEAQGEPHKPESAPTAETITYFFGRRGDLPELTLRWYDGGRRPPAELFEGRAVSRGGSILVGDQGKIYIPNDYGGEHILLPIARFKGLREPQPSLPLSPGHHRDFIESCRDPVRKACSDFSYSGPLTETALLGVLAFRLGGEVAWDSAGLRVPGRPEAEALIRPEYRKGWAL